MQESRALSNGDFLADLLRQEYAMQTPKAHIPIGIGAFLLVSALSPIGWLAFAAVGIVALDGERRLKKNREIVAKSYGNPSVLFEKLPKQGKTAVAQFAELYPLAAPLGQQKKSLPLPTPKPLPREGAKAEQAQTVTTSAATVPSGTRNQPGDGCSVGDLQWRDGEHLVMIGLSGSSKTTTLLNCVPVDSLVVYVTLKSEDKAPREWKAYRLRKFPDLSFLVQLENLCAMIRGLVQAGTRHRLIIDEALTMLNQAKAALKTVVDKEDKANYGAVVAEFEGLLKMYIWTGRSDGHWLDRKSVV